MSVALSLDFEVGCKDNIGGLELIHIGLWEDIDQSSVVITGGVITAIALNTGTKLQTYNLEKEVGVGLDTENVDVVNGTTFYDQTCAFTIRKMEAAKSVELKLVAISRTVIIRKDKNGKYFLMGLTAGVDKVGGTNTGGSGQAFGDFNGYALGFLAKEPDYAIEVDPAVIPALLIPAV